MTAGLSPAPAAPARGEIVVVLETRGPGAEPASPPDPERARRLAGSATLVDAGSDALAALLGEADRRGARAAVLLRAPPPDDARADWAELLAAPVVEGGLDYACPAFRRPRLDGMLNTAIACPLFRALFGRRLRQPCEGEAALSPALVRALRAAPGRARAAGAGGEAWLAAAALAGPWRVGQVWLPPRRAGAGPAEEDASHALARTVAPLFDEMARHAERWQRVEGSEPVPSFGDAGPVGGPAAVDVSGLVEAFRLGVRALAPLWGQVLPPATMLALRRAAADASARVADATWARVVYDFSLAHALRTVERQQLLRAMTPIYLGWVAGFARDVEALDAAASEARVEALCQAFEREKPYAIARWRWPDGFNP